MALKNAKYNEIMRTYQERQLQSHRRLEQRRSLLYETCPRLKEIDDMMASLSISKAKQLLTGDEDALFELKAELAQLAGERSSLLALHGGTHILEPAYVCPDCQDSGYIGSRKCHCLKQAIIDSLYETSNIRETLERENFNTFSFAYYDDKDPDPSIGLTPLKAAKRAVADSQNFVRNFDTAFENLFFYGNTGVGKTFLSNCIAKALLDSAHSVVYFSAFRLFELFAQQTFGTDRLEQDIHQLLFDCDLLIIDDLGTELTNSFVSSQLFLCVNERLLRRKSTIISTNLSISTFVSTYSERTFSRISSNYKIHKLIGADIRLRKKLQSGSSRAHA